MALYSKNGSYPAALPNRLVFPDGSTRTDKTTFTDEEMQDAGWTEVAYPPTVPYPNKLDWDGENLQWIVRPPNDRELLERWDELRSECDRLLSETDYKVTKAIENSFQNGTTINDELDPIWVTYRQALRDLYNNVNDIDPWNVVWPAMPTPSEE